MKQISFLNCLTAFLSLSCLTIVGVILFIVLFIQKLNNDPKIQNQNSESPDLSHMVSKNKDVESVVALVSDSENDWESLSRAVESIDTKLISNAFHLGDITQLGVESDMLEAKKITDNSEIKFNFIPGDRDLWKSSGIGNFKKVFGQNYQMVTVGSFNFLLIDNANEYEGITDEEWKFIEDNINNADFVLLHNPIYFSDSILGMAHKGMGQYSTEIESQRVRLLTLVRNSNVKAVFAGDQHLFSESADDDDHELNHYVLGALNSERNIQQPNYVLLTLYTDGDYHVEQVYLMPSPQPSADTDGQQ